MNPRIAVAAATIAFFYAAARTVERVSLARKWTAYERRSVEEAGRRRQPSDRHPPIEGNVSAAARDAGVRRLSSMATAPEGEICLDFESATDAAVRFLAMLQSRGLAGNLRRLRLSAAPGGVHAQATFAGADGSPAALVLPAKISNPFVSIPPAAAAVNRVSLARAEAARRREAAHEEEERRKADDVRRLEQRKAYFQNGFSVAGIAGAGASAVAFLTSAADHRSLMVKAGDAIEEARVTAVDPEHGEVRLDANGLFTIVLRLNGNRP